MMTDAKEVVSTLPDELLQQVFSHLKDASDLLRCAATSRTWRRASEHAHVWRTLYRSRWGRAEAEAAAADTLEEEESWREMALDRECREKQVVGILDDMVWPDRRSQARDKLRNVFGTNAGNRVTPGGAPGATADDTHNARRRRRRIRAVTYALDREIGWNGEKHLGRRCYAALAKRHVTEFYVCCALRDLFSPADGSSASSSSRGCVEICERVAALIARLVDNDQDERAVSAALDKMSAEFRRRVDASGAYGGVGDNAKTIENHPLPAITILNELFFDDPAAEAWPGQTVGGEAAPPGGSASLTGLLTSPLPASAVAVKADLLSPSFIVPESGGLGFTGNAQDYYDCWNSSLAAVLRRRTGIPITMTIVYAAVARRAGLAVRFLNTPGHFMSMVGPTEIAGARTWLAVDVFNRGEITELPESQMSEQFLQPTKPRDVCCRVLNNLRIILLQQNDVKSEAHNRVVKDPLLFAVMSAMIAMGPPVNEILEQRISLAFRFGFVEDALEDLLSMGASRAFIHARDDMEMQLRHVVQSQVNPEFSRKHMRMAKLKASSTRISKREGVPAIGAVFRRRQVPGGSDQLMYVVLDTHSVDDENKYGILALEIVGPSVNLDQKVKHVRLTSDDVQILEKLPDKIPILIECFLWCLAPLGIYFESFDVLRGVFVPDAYHRWLLDDDDGDSDDDDGVTTMDADTR